MPSWYHVVPALWCQSGTIEYQCQAGRRWRLPEQNAAPVHFYMDDSGTRIPDRSPTPFDPKRPNHFALGGVLVLEEDEVKVRAAHTQLSDKWGLT
jgi:hypothetical protein